MLHIAFLTLAGASKNGKALDLANKVTALRAERVAWYAPTQAPKASRRTTTNCMIPWNAFDYVKKIKISSREKSGTGTQPGLWLEMESVRILRWVRVCC